MRLTDEILEDETGQAMINFVRNRSASATEYDTRDRNYQRTSSRAPKRTTLDHRIVPELCAQPKDKARQCRQFVTQLQLQNVLQALP